MLSFQQLNINYQTPCLEILNANFSKPWAELETIFNTQSNLIRGAFIESELVGFVVLATVLNEGEVLMCAVKPKHHRKGIATALLEETINQLKGIDTLFLEVDVQNLSAQKLYKKMGFHIAGHRKNYYLQPDGTYHDAIILRLNLNN